MKIIELDAIGAAIIEPSVFGDERGYFLSTYDEHDLSSAGINFKAISEARSKSTKGVLRGLHFQLDEPQAKLINVIDGEIFDVGVDIRMGSPSFGKWVGIVLSAENFRQLYLPAGFAHGFLVRSDHATVIIKQSARYAPWSESGIAWDDHTLAIDWPNNKPLLSNKDAHQPSLTEHIVSTNLPLYKESISAAAVASCFLSYSNSDDAFTKQIYRDLEVENILCWFAPDDMNIGDRIRETLDQAIEHHNKLIIILSNASLQSDWVEGEVEKALEIERITKTNILLPITLDSAVFETSKAWAAHLRRTRHIGDFSDWENYEKYRSAFKRLYKAIIG